MVARVALRGCAMVGPPSALLHSAIWPVCCSPPSLSAGNAALSQSCKGQCLRCDSEHDDNGEPAG